MQTFIRFLLQFCNMADFRDQYSSEAELFLKFNDLLFQSNKLHLKNK